MPKYHKKAVSSTYDSVGFAVSAFSSTFTVNTPWIFCEIAESKRPSKVKI